MVVLVIAVAILVIFVGLRLVSFVVNLLASSRTEPRVKSSERVSVGATVNKPSTYDAEHNRQERNRMMQAERERLRREEGKRAADRAAANQRRIQEDMAKRSRDRVRAEVERMTRNTIKRNRGW